MINHTILAPGKEQMPLLVFKFQAYPRTFLIRSTGDIQFSCRLIHFPGLDADLYIATGIRSPVPPA